MKINDIVRKREETLNSSNKKLILFVYCKLFVYSMIYFVKFAYAVTVKDELSSTKVVYFII